MGTAITKDGRFWDKIADKYAEKPIDNEAAYQKKLEITRKYLTPEMSVMEFGCGTGSTAIQHAPFVNRILATDIAENMLAHGRRKAKEAGVSNITFERASIEDYEAAPNSFDVVLGLNIIHLCRDPLSVMQKVRAMLKPQGYFIQSTVCINEVNPLFRMAIPVLQVIGKAPHVTSLNGDNLLQTIDEAGLRIIEKWVPEKSAGHFIVAQKGLD